MLLASSQQHPQRCSQSRPTRQHYHNVHNGGTGPSTTRSSRLGLTHSDDDDIISSFAPTRRRNNTRKSLIFPWRGGGWYHLPTNLMIIFLATTCLDVVQVQVVSAAKEVVPVPQFQQQPQPEPHHRQLQQEVQNTMTNTTTNTTNMTMSPTMAPFTMSPTRTPSPTRTHHPTVTARPTISHSPTLLPSGTPTWAPTSSPQPSTTPSVSQRPSISSRPTISKPPSMVPSSRPSELPTLSPSISVAPSMIPSEPPTNAPTTSPQPSTTPTVSNQPTLSLAPTGVPSGMPTTSHQPTSSPTTPFPSLLPSSRPTIERFTAIRDEIVMVLDGNFTDILQDNQIKIFENVVTHHVQSYHNQLRRDLPDIYGVEVTNVVTKVSMQSFENAEASNNNNNNQGGRRRQRRRIQQQEDDPVIQETISTTATLSNSTITYFGDGLVPSISSQWLRVKYRQEITYGIYFSDNDNDVTLQEQNLFVHPFENEAQRFLTALIKGLQYQSTYLIELRRLEVGLNGDDDDDTISPTLPPKDDEKNKDTALRIVLIVGAFAFICVGVIIYDTQKLEARFRSEMAAATTGGGLDGNDGGGMSAEGSVTGVENAVPHDPPVEYPLPTTGGKEETEEEVVEFEHMLGTGTAATSTEPVASTPEKTKTTAARGGGGTFPPVVIGGPQQQNHPTIAEEEVMTEEGEEVEMADGDEALVEEEEGYAAEQPDENDEFLQSPGPLAMTFIDLDDYDEEGW